MSAPLVNAKVSSSWGRWIVARPGAVLILNQADAQNCLTPAETRQLIAILTEAADVAEGKSPEAADGQ